MKCEGENGKDKRWQSVSEMLECQLSEMENL